MDQEGRYSARFLPFNCAQHYKVGIDKNNRSLPGLHRTAFSIYSGTASAPKQRAYFGRNFSMGVLDMPFEIEKYYPVNPWMQKRR